MQLANAESNERSKLVDDRKLLVLPVIDGNVSYATDEWITIAGRSFARSRIVGRQPERDEWVLVLDVHDLVSAIIAQVRANKSRKENT